MLRIEADFANADVDGGTGMLQYEGKPLEDVAADIGLRDGDEVLLVSPGRASEPLPAIVRMGTLHVLFAQPGWKAYPKEGPHPGASAAVARSVWVFASNLARVERGAFQGEGEGRQANSYGIPTRDAELRPLPLDGIGACVQRFLAYAAAHPDVQFQIRGMAAGLAGHRHEDIAPMFAAAPANCHLPAAWRVILDAAP
jgi:hypothetical protein